MNAQDRFEEAASRYLPQHLRLLFIAEAPPAYKVNRFFYFTDLTNGDTLFLEMMKVLYPAETAYVHDGFQPGFSAKLIRQRKPELLRRFQSDGYYLIDAYEQPMPDSADQAAKARLMQSTLPLLQRKVQRLVGEHHVPIIMIGAVTYSICAEALRLDGRQVTNQTAIDHPARGGQKRFRAKLRSVLNQLAE